MPYRVYGNIECFGRRRERLLPRPRMRPAPVVYVAAITAHCAAVSFRSPESSMSFTPLSYFSPKFAVT